MLDTISVWDEKLSKLTYSICKLRKEAIESINKNINNINSSFDNEVISILYIPSIKGDIENKENIKTQLEKGLKRDLEYGITMTGPHRDDFEILMNGKNIKNFGSQGQQRTSILKLKIAESEIIKEKTGEMPPILLDDILSELDEKRRKLFIENINDRQVIITCTDKDFLKGMKANFYKVSDGLIYKE